MANQESAIASLYSSTGVAWYYILYTANHRFKLPRTKWGFVGLRDTVGSYVAESLPNITASLTGDLRTQGELTPGGAFTTTEQGNSYTGFGLYNGKQITAINLNASRSSAAYQNNAPVQQRATQMYLYFYVGKFNQTATEQTAGLKAELFNGKADLDVSNLSSAGKSKIAGLGMPSTRFTELTLGNSQDIYTMPASGYVAFQHRVAAAGDAIGLWQVEGVTGPIFRIYSSAANQPLALSLPVKKGSKIRVEYSSKASNTSTNYFRFIYAEGDE